MSGQGGDDPEGFLSRWSARKRAEEVTPVDGPEAAALPAEPPTASAPEAPDPDLIALLPRIEDIGPGTDIRGFMQKGVPRALRNAALRRAWAANPAIASYEDPARDYFWDYNAPGGAPGSGGSITAEDARRMAERILRGPPPADPPAAETAEGKAPAPGEMADDPADGAAQGNPGAGPPPPAAPDAAESMAEEPPVPRRHGGAVPT